MKVASGNDKQALQELDPNFMSHEEDGEDLAGTWIVRSPPWRNLRLSSMLLHEVARTKLTASRLRTLKSAELKECHLPTLHHPLHQHGHCVLMTEREPMRGPPLHCQQCHPNNFAPSHLSLPQNMAVEMKVMKIWTIYFQTVLLEFLGKEGVFEYYKTKPLFLNIQCM